MDFAEWPGLVDNLSGLFNQPVPALTATMWWAELRHYDAARVSRAFTHVARDAMSPFLPPLGVILNSIRNDGMGTPIETLGANKRFLRGTNDQFLLTKGGSSTDEEGDPDDDDVFARGLICATAGCGYTPVLACCTACPLCGNKFMPDGYMLAQGTGGEAA